MAEPEPLRYDSIDFHSYDYGLVLCTPWIWALCANGVKYGLLRSFTNRIVSRNKFALGTGSAFHLDHDDRGNEPKWGSRTVDDVRDTWQAFDQITCRDRLAYALFADILPEGRVTLMPCPSFYIAQVFNIRPTKTRREVLVYCQIDSQIFWKVREDQVDRAMAFQDELVRSGVEVLTMIPLDFEAFRQRYNREPAHYVRDPIDIVRTLGLYKKVISARVHACMPALSLGLEVEIIPLDTRALTATSLGAKPIVNSLERAEEYAEPIEPLSFKHAITLLRQQLHLGPDDL